MSNTMQSPKTSTKRTDGLHEARCSTRLTVSWISNHRGPLGGHASANVSKHNKHCAKSQGSLLKLLEAWCGRGRSSCANTKACTGGGRRISAYSRYVKKVASVIAVYQLLPFMLPFMETLRTRGWDTLPILTVVLSAGHL